MIKHFSLFSGIGAFEAALDNIGIDFELVGYSEIDKYASKSYSAIHGVPESMNYGDITKINEKKLPKDIDLITYGFPCQDISLAGKQKGLFNEDGSQTRSGLFFEALRIIEETKPKIAIAENVKNLVGKKFKEQFEIVLSSLEEVGYNNYWKVLNAKDYGILQNRERVFIVSIRKDIDTGVFEFPEGYPLEKRLKDMLEDKVDEKFYLNNKGTSGIINALTDGREHKPNILSKDTEYSPTIDTRVGSQTHRSPYIEEPVRLGGLYDTEASKRQAGAIWDKEAISPTIDTMQGGNRQPLIVVNEPSIQVIGNYSPSNHDASRIVSAEGLAPTVKENHGTVTAIAIKENNKTGYKLAYEGDGVNICSRMKYQRGNVQKDSCQTLTCSGGNDRGVVVSDMQGLRIRKLTPKECFRLMGFNDDFEQAASVNSNTQLYKQAGNSIVVDVLEELFCMMFDEEGNFFI